MGYRYPTPNRGPGAKPLGRFKGEMGIQGEDRGEIEIPPPPLGPSGAEENRARTGSAYNRLSTQVTQKHAYSCAHQRTNVAALDKQQANGLLILARATGGMDQQIDIALAPWRVPFACFGLSRVRFAGFCVPVGWLRLRKE